MGESIPTRHHGHNIRQYSDIIVPCLLSLLLLSSLSCGGSLLLDQGHVDQISCSQADEVCEDLRQIAENNGLEQLQPEDLTGFCYATRANAFVIRADGRVGKCSVALDHPANRVGWINPDGTLDIDNDLILPWLRGLASGDEEVLACPLKGIPGPPADQAEASRRSVDFVKELEQRLTIPNSNPTAETGEN